MDRVGLPIALIPNAAAISGVLDPLDQIFQRGDLAVLGLARVDLLEDPGALGNDRLCLGA